MDRRLVHFIGTAALAALLALPAFAARVDVGGTLAVNTTWTADNVYVLSPDVSVPAGVTLTIQPGTVVKGGNGLWISGTLLAEGTPGAPIAFTSLQDDTKGGDTNGDGGATAPAPGHWRGLVFAAGSHGRISNASVSYGGCGGYCYGKANVETDTTDLRLDAVVLQYSGRDGLYANHASPAVTGCTIQNNGWFGLHFVGLDPAAPLNITDNMFTSSGGGGGLLAFDALPTPTATFRGNRSTDGKCAFSVQGTANGDLVWDNGDDLVLYLSNDLAVAASRTLTLLPGTVVKSIVGYSNTNALWVDGFLFAEGTESAPITFTSLHDDSRGGDTNADGAASSPAPGNWRGVIFRAGSHGRISNASFSYGGCGGYCYGKGNIETYTSGLDLDRVLIEKSHKDGLYAKNASPTVTNCTIANNTGYGLRFDGLDPAFPLTVTDNIFTSAGGGAGMLAFDGLASAAATFRGNRSSDGKCAFSVQGTANGNLVWDNGDDLPLYIPADFAVAASRTLILMPGTVVKLSGTGLYMDGTLLAEGAPGAPIAFTSLQDDTKGGDTNADGAASAPAPGQYRGVYFRAGSHGRISNASFSYGGCGGYCYGRGLIVSYISDLQLDGVLLEKSGREGIWGIESGMTVKNSSILGNAYGVRNDSADLWIEARYNWWGDASGPYNATLNATGTGNAVSDKVNFFPWATDPGGTAFSFVNIQGPATVFPGDRVTYSVQYQNTLSYALHDVVLLVDLPNGLSHAGSTGGALFYTSLDCLNQIFWKLGTLEPGASGKVTFTLSSPWGTPNAQTWARARLGAGDFPGGSSFDVAPYLAFVPEESIAEWALSGVEIQQELAANAALSTLHQSTLASGYAFFNTAMGWIFPGGERLIRFFYVRSPDAIPAVLTCEGDTAFLELFEGNTYAVSDGAGGYVWDRGQGMFTPWGTWAVQAQSRASLTGLREARCQFNCTLNSIPDTAASKLISLYSTFKYISECVKCASSLKAGTPDYESCTKCTVKAAERNSKTIAEKIPGVGTAVSWAFKIKNCFDDCQANPDSHICTQPKKDCGCWDVLGWVSGFESKCITNCNRTTGTYDPITHRVQCAFGEVCSGGDCVDKSSVCSGNACKEKPLALRASHDPNLKRVDFLGEVLPGQRLTYTLEYENAGAGTAFGVFILDTLDPNLDETTLSINNGGAFSAGSRMLDFEIGDVLPGGQGSVSFSIAVKAGAPHGTELVNQADIYFPNALEITPTNAVVNRVATVVADPKEVEAVAGAPVAVTLVGRSATGGALTYRIVSQPAFGALSGNPPSVIYTADSQYVGPDTFSYAVSDGTSESTPAEVRILVGPSPDDHTPPQVLSTFPESGATGILPGQNPVGTDPIQYTPSISATFSEPLDPASVAPGSMVVTDLTGTVAYDAASRTLSFVPGIALAGNRAYTARVLAGVKDTAGNAMPAEYPWTFTTGTGAGIPGDCDGSGTVSIGEVQKAINMFLGTLAPGCGVDCNGNGTVSIGEVQKVINGFLGLASAC
jgi:uncharacterized repeat protein (TIGR01451 family)